MVKPASERKLINLGEIVRWLQDQHKIRLLGEIWLAVLCGGIDVYEGAYGEKEPLPRDEAAMRLVTLPDGLWADLQGILLIAEQEGLLTNQGALGRLHRRSADSDPNAFHMMVKGAPAVKVSAASPAAAARAPKKYAAPTPMPSGFPPIRE